MNNYEVFYSKLTGFSPYDYQQKVAELLLSGKNVILSVPTGSGKTFASILPFLYAKQRRITNFPNKLIYSLPLRTLANSIYSDLNKVLKGNICEKESSLSSLLSIQTGEYCDDPYFEKDIIISTIDQTLSNYLCFPLALSHNQGNMNAGAIVGSYLVFDEFHLLDFGLSMATTIGMLQRLKNLCRFCIMTATLTDEYIQYICSVLENMEVVSIKKYPNDCLRVQSLVPAIGKKVKKTISVCYSPLDYKIILEQHVNKTIVICNRIETAQQIFRDLCKDKNESTKILCIHSRFFDSDRKSLETKIKEYFGKYSKQKDVILVATQIIEAGMDISCDLMFTEISPINSFLQRAGRCARFGGEYGRIFVYDVIDMAENELLNQVQDENNKDEIKALKNKYLPYSSDLCQLTLAALSKYDYLDEMNSEELVNSVLRDDETNMFNIMSGKQFNIPIIRKSWVDCDKKHYRETIRDIQSLDIILIDFNENLNDRIVPSMYETISMYKWSFISKIRQLKKEFVDDPLIAKAEQCADSVFDFDWKDLNEYYLKEMDESELKFWTDVVFVNNRFFDYNLEGLIVCENGNGKESPIKSVRDKTKENIVFKMDTFYQHNKALLNCYNTEFQPKMTFKFEELNRYWCEQFDWNKLLQLAIVFHDYGKLNMKWQKPMVDFQYIKSGGKDFGETIAHTDYNKLVDDQLAKKCGVSQKPSHAGIGASKVYDIMMDKDFCEEIARAVSCSILKHHNVETEKSASSFIKEGNLIALRTLLTEIGYSFDISPENRESEDLSDLIPTKDKEWFAYFILVRILRMCDQKATKEIEKYL